ncbi:bifunctional diaminohydroxyphosphoribosylaminopyrimidine deaminase/5-amino-6-(5-phosphoribosylamino)uracil reductase RibD [Muricauda sp. DJ-13]|uniref:Riboflavin biosynthesis protein RibD n=2 Tax=Croceivirga thetidis TaxID=2721623 RepID=A0ABX1GSI2_9FLAO|nr:bifunctional diaminohydroxyphosphoribosylaminopyrimidine deaminase/5-amino-6-(5-phosphoribosylamino)uracil reductase RibD [Croceivirga thetidis]NKI32569.1 bifunctional diaminohydroxyphosphoribosylaminopyrimidine deaminase/5-amino-6-(5-phosphoribosylamino)uracil reductase RibD [Croceivirga thetidis]
MLRAIELGKKAISFAAPNPMVGCVIVHNDRIIGEGFTSAYGGPHAEVNAINSVNDKSILEKATLYVTLEPCSHFGKTPPCANLIAKHKIPKVVIGLVDPNTKVSGAGIKKLRDSGSVVVVGVLEDECREHHKRFLTFQEKKRPYVILKWAESQDGFIAPDKIKRDEAPQPYWITNSISRQLVHKWRSEEMAILVGTNTVFADNPKLNVRSWKGRSSIRVVLDRELKIPIEFFIYDGSVKTIVVTESKSHFSKENTIFEFAEFGANLAASICEILYKHNINSLLVEGGQQTLQTFINEDIWDEAYIFKGENSFEAGIAAPTVSGCIVAKQKILEDGLTLLTK